MPLVLLMGLGMSLRTVIISDFFRHQGRNWVESWRPPCIRIISNFRIYRVQRCMRTWWITAVPIGCGIGLLSRLKSGAGFRVGQVWRLLMGLGLVFPLVSAGTSASGLGLSCRID